MSNKKTRCPVASQCGGCKYINLDYKETLVKKQKEMEKLLGGFGKVEPIIGMDNPFHYRNKVTATFHHKRNGEIISGIYAENSHKVIPVESCLIENEKADEIIQTIKGMLKSFKITVHNEDTGYGLLKHVMVRTARKTGQIMVILVTSSPIFPSKKNFAKALINKHPEITTIVQNINEKKTTMVLGERNQTLYGRGFIEDILCGKRFKLSPLSFYQVNSLQTEVLYNKAIEFAGLTGKERIIDAYCGIGTIGIVASDYASEVIGVELNRDAVKDAITNAKLNDCKNITFYSNDAGRFLVGMANQKEKADVVFLDPPRSGSTPEFLDSVMKLSPKKIVYISCGPDTLARDLKYIKNKGMYKIERMVPVDLFGFTEHVETVCLLSRKAPV